MKLIIKVNPNSKKSEIIKISDNNYKVSLKSPADKNKANTELLKLLKKYFGKEARIIKGMKSKNKIVELKERI